MANKCSFLTLLSVCILFYCRHFNELPCSSKSRNAVPWPCIHFHEHACSSMQVLMSCHAVPWVYMKYHELACSSMSLYAVPLFVWAAHKNFAVLVYCWMLIQFFSGHILTLLSLHLRYNPSHKEVLDLMGQTFNFTLRVSLLSTKPMTASFLGSVDQPRPSPGFLLRYHLINSFKHL